MPRNRRRVLRRPGRRARERARGLDAVARQPPPRAGLFRPKLRYAHQGGSNPPTIVIHGNQLDRLPDSYRRYLERVFADAFRLRGTPLRLQMRTGENPYARRK